MNRSNESYNGEIVEGDSFAVIVIKELAFAIVTFVALVGNSLVIAAVFQTARMRTITNYLIVNMAIVDIFFSLIAVPNTFANVSKHIIVSKTVFFEFVLCKGINFCRIMLQGVSVLTLAAIAADRYFAIMVPFKKLMTKGVFYVVLLMIWVVGIAVASPIFYAYKVIEEEEGNLFCGENWGPVFDDEESSKIYTVVLFIVLYCISFFVMTVIYSIICNKLWTRKLIGELNQSGKKILESRKKVVKMLVTVLVGFVVCWLPVQIVSLWGYFENIPDIPQWLMDVSFFLMYAHPALNPCIYAIFSENFRDGFKMALKCFCCRGNTGTSSLVGNPTYMTRNATCKERLLIDRKQTEVHVEASTAKETVFTSAL